MHINNKTITIEVVVNSKWLDAIAPPLMNALGPNSYPLRFSMVDAIKNFITIEVTTVEFAADDKYASAFENIALLHPRKKTYQSEPFTIAQIVPTGIRCEFGGYAGDAVPVTNLLASVADFVVTHPNAVNASDINEMASNVLYVEGKSLDDFMLGHLGLRRKLGNRIGTIMDPTGDKLVNEVTNVLNAARATAGIDCSRFLQLDKQIGVTVSYTGSGSAGGYLEQPEVLLDGVEQLISLGAEAVGGVSVILGVSNDMFINYVEAKNPNPSGAVEAIITHLISKVFQIPTAHAPLPYYQQDYEKAIENPRASAELISTPHYFCVLKGLHRAPQLVSLSGLDTAPTGLLTLNNIGAVVIPSSALGGIPALAAEYNDIPLIAVRENSTILEMNNEKLGMSNVIEVSTYFEAAGVVAALKAGIAMDSLSRPLHALSEVDAETFVPADKSY